MGASDSLPEAPGEMPWPAATTGRRTAKGAMGLPLADREGEACSEPAAMEEMPTPSEDSRARGGREEPRMPPEEPGVRVGKEAMAGTAAMGSAKGGTAATDMIAAILPCRARGAVPADLHERSRGLGETGAPRII